MKRKSRLCSTGHDTGVIQEVPLGKRIFNERANLLEKQVRRALKHPHTLPSRKVQKLIAAAMAQPEEERKGFNLS